MLGTRDTTSSSLLRAHHLSRIPLFLFFPSVSPILSLLHCIFILFLGRLFGIIFTNWRYGFMRMRMCNMSALRGWNQIKPRFSDSLRGVQDNGWWHECKFSRGLRRLVLCMQSCILMLQYDRIQTYAGSQIVKV